MPSAFSTSYRCRPSLRSARPRILRGSWTYATQAGRVLSLAMAIAFVVVFAFLLRRLVRDWRIATLAAFALAFSGGLADGNAHHPNGIDSRWLDGDRISHRDHCRPKRNDRPGVRFSSGRGQPACNAGDAEQGPGHLSDLRFAAGRLAIWIAPGSAIRLLERLARLADRGLAVRCLPCSRPFQPQDLITEGLDHEYRCQLRPAAADRRQVWNLSIHDRRLDRAGHGRICGCLARSRLPNCWRQWPPRSAGQHSACSSLMYNIIPTTLPLWSIRWSRCMSSPWGPRPRSRRATVCSAARTYN